MSQETPILLYVGNDEMGQWLETIIASQNGYVYTEHELLSALGLYVSYMPDLVVLDARALPDLARQVYSHLRSIDAENIVILDDNPEDWEFLQDRQIYVLTSSCKSDKSDLLIAIGNVLGTSFVISEGVS